MAEVNHHAGILYTGTAAERGAMSTALLPPGSEFIESDTNNIWEWDGAAWKQLDAVASPNFAANVTLDDGVGDSPLLRFVGASNELATLHFDDTTRSLVVTLEDDKAEALRIIDEGGGDDYLTIVSTDAQREVVINQDGADIDTRMEAVGFTHALFVQGSDGYVGIGGIPAYRLDVQAGGDNIAATFNSTDPNALISFEDDTTGGAAIIAIGAVGTSLVLFTAGLLRVAVNQQGDFGAGIVTGILAQMHVDQSSASGAQPVLLLDQADDSEEMIEFVGTIGVGNAIEAIGAKALTTTHFIKVTLPGALTRYLPVGTIA